MLGAATPMPTRSIYVMTASVTVNAVTTYRALVGGVFIRRYWAGSSFTAITRQRQKPPSTHRGVFSSV